MYKYNGPVIALTNFAGGGSIGTAPTTVDIANCITINQTTAGQTLTLPALTDATAVGYTVDIYNIGSTPFTIQGTVITNAFGARLGWTGAAWALFI